MKKITFSKKMAVAVIGILTITIGGTYYFVGGFGSSVKIEPVSDSTSAVKTGEIKRKIKLGDKITANSLAKELVAGDDTVDNRKLLVYTEQLTDNDQGVIDAYAPIIENKQLNFQDYQDIADAYYHTDEKLKAAKYYRMTADIWPSDDPSRDYEREYLYGLADLLEGKNTDA